MEKEWTFEELKKQAEEASKKRFEDYFVKSHEMLMKRRSKFQLAHTEIPPLVEEINPIGRFISECHSTLARKESEQIEHILRNFIDDPIIGPISKESLKARCIRTILYKEPNVMDSRFEQSGNDMTFTFTSGLLGVVQGDYLIGIDGKRSRLTEEQNKRLFEMGV